MLLVAVGVAFQGGGNPTILQGGSASFPRTGYDYPTTAMTWDIVNPSGTVIATDDTPNGWNLVVVNDNLNVSCPTTATVANNYEVRFSGEYQDFPAGQLRAKARPSNFNGNWAASESLSHARRKGEAHPDDIIIVPVTKSAYFNVISANAPPNAPTTLTATAVASNRINLSWHDNSTNEGGFKVYRLAPGGSWNLVTTTAANITSLSDMPLLPSTSYSYKVLAFNTYGDSAYTNVASAQTFDLTPPPPGYAGNEFYFALPESGPTGQGASANPHLRVSSDSGASGLLTTLETGESIPFTVTAGGSIALNLPESRRMTQSDAITHDSFRITSDNPINVMMLDEKPAASESWSVLPTTVLGTEYVSTNYAGTKDIHRSVIALVATQDNTVVTITPKTVCGTPPAVRQANVPFTVMLQAGDTYQIKTFPGSDLSGSSITSTKPIALYSGTVGSMVPLYASYDNPLMEQLLPFDRWSSDFVGIPLSTHARGYYRITAGRRYTTVSVYNGATGATTTYPMDKGDKLDLDSLDPLIVTSDKPIQAMQLAAGQYYDHVTGDPMMMPMPSITSPTSMRTNWMTTANIYVPSGDAMANYYVTLITDSHVMTTLNLNGSPISGWHSIGTTSMKYVSLSLAPGNNVINGVGGIGSNTPARFVASTYGFNDFDAEGAAIGGAVLTNSYVNIKPTDPSPLVATAVSAHEIDLSWTTSQDAYGYRLERKTDSTDWSLLIDTSSTTGTFADTNLPHKTKYYYRVTAYADEDSNVSNTANATTFNEKPAMPGNLAASALSDSQIKLTWTDNSDNEDHFVIQRSLNGQSGWTDVQTTDPSVTTWTDSNLNKKTTYYYHIKSTNEMGDLGWSGTAYATTKDTKPNAPTLTSVTGVSYNAIDLTWVDNSDNEDGFRIDRWTGTSWSPVGNANADATTFHDTYALNPLTTYNYRVVAFNNGGESPSNELSGSTLTPPAPNAPTNLSATMVSDTEIQLAWTDNSTIEQGFRVERRVDGSNTWDFLTNTGVNQTSFKDSTCLANTKYWYHVRAYNQGGNSTWSNEASATTESVPPPGIDSYLQDVILGDDVLVSSGGVVTTSVTVKLRSRPTTNQRVYLSASTSSIALPPFIDVQAGQRTATATATVYGQLADTEAILAKSGDWTQRASLVTVSSSSGMSVVSAQAVSSGHARIVTWQPMNNLVFRQSLKGYQILRSVDNGPFTVVSPTLTSSRTFVDLDSLSDGANVRYQVQVIGRSGAATGSTTSPAIANTNMVLNGTLSVQDIGDSYSVEMSGVPNALTYHLVLGNQVLCDLSTDVESGIVRGEIKKSNLSSALTSPNLEIISDPDDTGFAVQSNAVSIQLQQVPSLDEGDRILDSDAGVMAGFRYSTNLPDSTVTFQVKNSLGSVIKQVTGYDHALSWVWDGKDTLGNDAPEGDYDLTISQGSSSTQTKRKVVVVRQGAKFLVLYNTNIVFNGNSFSERYENTVRANVSSICSSGVVKMVFIPFEDTDAYSDAMKKTLISLFKKSQYFYYYGHGRHPHTPTTVHQTLDMGSYAIRNYTVWYYGSSTMDGICIPAIAPYFQSQYKFIWVDACFSAGYDASKPLPHMTSTPNQGWLEAFNMTQQGASLTWNGLIPGVSSGGILASWLGQGTYREQLWIALASGRDMDASLTYALIHTPGGADFQGYGPPWNQIKLYGDPLVSLP
ncbi:MAG: hypothetical protein GC165_00240 [Armatimonadetes bacterium]|nr:hypothetical protein [Armatimonadota bacterium]